MDFCSNKCAASFFSRLAGENIAREAEATFEHNKAVEEELR